MKTILPFFISFLFVLSHSVPLNAQKWAVHFTDKKNLAYSIDRPEEFLSQRSIDRRRKYVIEVTEEDLPVNASYVEQLKQLGADILGTSKWLNCALINPSSQNVMTRIGQLEFVDKIVKISNHYTGSSSMSSDKIDNKKNNFAYKISEFKSLHSESEYGLGYHQINQINGIPVHKQGFTGSGILITILDGGFKNANQLDVFKHIRNRNGIVFEYDVVSPGGNIYNVEEEHGTNVFSCLGSKIEGAFIGTAPDANYALIRTEDATSENLIEEYNWAIGAELADSIGSDIINSSIGYDMFDENTHVFTDMNGRKAVTSYAAYRAVGKGIFVCVAAGNSRRADPWPWIGTPADVPEVATIGAVYKNGTISYFSSIGPNAVGFPKPDIVALGSDVTIVRHTNEMVTYGSGTSLSCPIVCGMVACMIQAFPQIPPLELKEMINKTGNYYGNHQIDYGYGIPDFGKVYANYTGIPDVKLASKVRVYPNPVSDNLYISSEKRMSKIILRDLSGKTHGEVNCNSTTVTLSMSSYNKGIWLLELEFEAGLRKIIKIVKR